MVKVTFGEGSKQLLTVIGLLIFLHEDEFFYAFLDLSSTLHLNPLSGNTTTTLFKKSLVKNLRIV